MLSYYSYSFSIDSSNTTKATYFLSYYSFALYCQSYMLYVSSPSRLHPNTLAHSSSSLTGFIDVIGSTPLPIKKARALSLNPNPNPTWISKI